MFGWLWRLWGSEKGGKTPASRRPKVAASLRKERTYDDFLQERAERLGVTKEEAIVLAGTPEWLRRLPEHLEERAAAEGVTVDEWMRRDLQRMQEHITPDCIEPHEIERYVNFGEVSDSRRIHFDSCRYCGNILRCLKRGGHSSADA